MSLSLAQRKNIRDWAEKNKAHLETLKVRALIQPSCSRWAYIASLIAQEATGVEFVYEVDFATIVGKLPKDISQQYRDEIGEIVYETYPHTPS